MITDAVCKPHISRATKEDVAIGEGLIQAAFSEEFESVYGFSPNPKVMSLCHAMSWAHGFMLRNEKGEVVGAVAGFTPPDTPDVMVQSVWYVKKDYRRFAFDLMKVFEEHCREIGVKRIVATCMGADRLEAKIRTFKINGFELVETKYIKEII